MPKKTTKDVLPEVAVVARPLDSQITQLSASFGTEDMNKVVEKINEIILRLNSVV